MDYNAKNTQTESNNSELPKSFLDLLVVEKPYRYKFKKHKPRKYRNETLSYEVDDQIKFRNGTVYARVNTNTNNNTKNTGHKVFAKRKQTIKEIDTLYKAELNGANVVCDVNKYKHPFDIVDWENDIIYDVDDKVENANQTTNINEFVESTLEEQWEKFVVMDDSVQTKYKNYPTMYLEDPNLIFDKTDEKKNAKNKKRHKEYFTGDKPIRSKYNISNDRYYISEMKLKSNLGSFGVQHSLLALKLEPKYYKTNHSKMELRNFHRPPFVLPCNTFVQCMPLIKTESHKSNVIKKTSDLTLKDSSDFVLFEYSEETPPFIVNCGMVSLINTYYRKTSTRDEYDNEQSNINILDNDDPSPFFSFGDVKPGTTMKSLTNNLYTSPIFQHDTDDYLCVLDTSGTHNVFVRKITSLYCVGQEFPLEEIYAPHSRKLNVFCKNRLKVAAYRLFGYKNNGLKEFKMSQLDQLFPYFSEGSKRKWLKEYADCVKKGKENIWVLKATSSVLSEEDLRKLITPENICQYESMLASERRLEDLGYKCAAEDEDEDEDVFIIPWQLTRNFINACNGKGLLELIGPADPTGIGEGYSFRKLKLIKGNETENRKIISEHQARYKTEIDKIWNKQFNSLSSSKDIPFDPQYIQEAKPQKADPVVVSTLDSLVIKRTYIGTEGEQIEIERITDPRVIKMYMKLRKVYKYDDKKPVLKCGNCGQVGHMKTNKYCPKFIQPKKPTKKKIDHDRKRAKMLLQDVLMNLVNAFFAMPFSMAFHKPVSAKKFPDYPTIVSTPIDLTTIKTKVRHNKYTKYQEFVNDIELMLDNCKKYNGADHSLTKVVQGMADLAYEKQASEEQKIKEAERIFAEYEEE